ncbi:histone H1-like [Amblyraja radiata]|uniref:histone H1-like n=1 Tax=Amblyraja radiata TaxID=386614 RepID=UPI001401D108|nr:histone H1-like [Amblyraja radiata]
MYRGQFWSPRCPILIGITGFLKTEKHSEAEGPGVDSRMSPPRPLAAFKLLSAAATRFNSHSVLSVRENLCIVADMTETAAAEAVPQAVPTAQTKAPKKKKPPARSKAAGLKLGEQIDKLVADCRDRRGLSLFAIKKSLAANRVDVDKCRHLIKMCIKRRLVNGLLVQNKGSFKTGKGEAAVKSVKKAKISAAKTSKSKKPTAKKPPTKKSLAKKSTPKKPAVKKVSTKKVVAKKPAAKLTAAKKASPKKAATKTPQKAAKKPVKRQVKAKSKKAASKK